MYRITGKKYEWEIVIGLEVHAQINSRTKLFSTSPTEYSAEPNTQISFVDAAMPGMLPVMNKYCVEQAICTGLGLNATINLLSVFDRKNYFYPDLPQGYQISQYTQPIVSGGKLEIALKDGTKRDIGITRLHIEQDAGKSIHDQSPTLTFIDLNRSGVGLMEIVSEPDMRSSEEACEYVKKLRSILRYLGTCDGDMEKGNLRCDANVSVRPVGEQKFGTRCEIKNINSIRNIMRAIDYEAERQVQVLESGGVIDQETRLFDADTNTTRTMRSKEDAHDYRYFPDPDLPPLTITEDLVEEIRNNLPELPDQKKQKYMSNMGLSAYDAEVLVQEKETTEFFETVASAVDPKLAANWITVELFGRLNKTDKTLLESPIKPQHLIDMINLITNNTISGKLAKQVFDIMYETGDDPNSIVEKQGLKQVTDSGELVKIIDQVLQENSAKVEEYRSGKDRLFGFFVGQVMKLSEGKANPSLVNEILKNKLISN